MATNRLQPEVRKAALMDSAIELAREVGYDRVKRADIAAHAGVANSLVTRYWGTMTQLRRALMREAIKRKELKIIAQGITREDPHARKAPKALREQALALF